MAAKHSTVSVRQMERRSQAWHSLAAIHLAQGRAQVPLFGVKKKKEKNDKHGQHFVGSVPVDCLQVPNVMD